VASGRIAKPVGGPGVRSFMKRKRQDQNDQKRKNVSD